ncbi:hypothetical protein [Oceanobacillus kapialis]|uniref:Uncharacterized protein n=1 Tax=Oceanobacillus kapialis TaxID=481353 RepID=A0ABW5PWC4_9BACI
MRLRWFLLAFSAGYLIAVLLVHFVFGYFSLGFVAGSAIGVILFALIIAPLKSQRRDN